MKGSRVEGAESQSSRAGIKKSKGIAGESGSTNGRIEGYIFPFHNPTQSWPG